MLHSDRIQKVTFYFTLSLGFLWSLYRLVMNEGWILDDEIGHYVFSRSVWENPEQLFNHWTRPGRNLMHFLVTPLGFTATRSFTLLLALLATWVTLKVGDLLGLRYLFLVPACLMFQSWFPELSYPVLTQTPVMLVWIVGIWAALKKRYHWAGFFFGYLSLIRHEGILLSGLWGLWVSAQPGGVLHKTWGSLKGDRTLGSWGSAVARDTRYALSTVSAILLYNLAAYLSTGHWPFSIYFESKPTTMYGSGTLFHYVPLLIWGVGFVSTILCTLGLLAIRRDLSKWSLIIVSYGFYFVAHSLIYWKGAFASGGYYHFIMPMAPALALLSVSGVEWLVRVILKPRVPQKTQGAVLYLILALLLAQGLSMAHHQLNYQNWAKIMQEGGKPEFSVTAPPLKQGVHSRTVIEASDWAVQQNGDGPVFAKHVAHNFHRGNLSTKAQVEAENAALYQMPIDTYFIWDSLYCEFENRIKFDSFNESHDWEIVRVWKKEYPAKGATEPEDIYRVVVFHKVSKLDTQDKQYAELGEADKVDQIYE